MFRVLGGAPLGGTLVGIVGGDTGVVLLVQEDVMYYGKEKWKCG